MKKQTQSAAPAAPVNQFETADIPLKQLTEWDGNVRTVTSQSIEALAASIRADGLIQPLVVQQNGKATYRVGAGKRRLRALRVVFPDGKQLIPCRIVASHLTLDELKAISLAENFHQEPMHPADEFAAFNDLANAGKSVEDIALRFGVPEYRVKQRLALARVSPKLFQRYRDGELTLEHLQAFTVTASHEKQEQVWDKLPSFSKAAWQIRNQLRDGAIPASDRRVRYVTLAKYEAEGGAVLRDLFSTEEDGITVTDEGLLNQMALAKLTKLAGKISKEGWKWVEVYADQSELYEASQNMQGVAPEYLPLPKKLAMELAAAESRLAEIERHPDPPEELLNEIGTLEDRITEIQDTRESAFTDEQKQHAGVLVSLDDKAKPMLRYCIRKEDQKTLKKETAKAAAAEAKTSGQPETDTADYSAALIEDLTAHRTAALAAALAAKPDVALRILAHTMAMNTFAFEFRTYNTSGVVEITSRPFHLPVTEETKAGKSLDGAKDAWMKVIPHETPEAIWQWFIYDAQIEDILSLLAYCTATTLNAVISKTTGETGYVQRREKAVKDLHRVIGADMNDWIELTAENFFSRISKPALLQAWSESGKEVPKDAGKLKKSELAAAAKAAIAGTGWLPECLKTPAEEGEAKK